MGFDGGIIAVRLEYSNEMRKDEKAKTTTGDA
jgi:hypothetical protein